MEGVGGDGTWAAAVEKRRHQVSKHIESCALYRWIGSLTMVLLYALRVYYVGKFSLVINCALGFYLLYLLDGFLSPRYEPELPTNSSDEFKPFVRRLSEFQFWCGITKAFTIVFLTTFFPMFDIPILGYLLLGELIIIGFGFTWLRISHMTSYKYFPFDLGKSKQQGVGGHGTWIVVTAAVEQRRHEVSTYIHCCALYRWIGSLVMYRPLYRWIGTLAMVLLYALRVYYVGGFSIAITYALGIYLFFLPNGFLSPLYDLTDSSNEFKPFIRRLPELKFWCGITKGFTIAFLTTLIPMFDIPILRYLLLGELIIFGIHYMVFHISNMWLSSTSSTLSCII